MITKNDIAKILTDEGLISEGQVQCEPLEGGVSSDIFLLSEGSNALVVKQALPRLRVADHWHADVSRNQTEQAFIRFLQRFRPEAVPRLLYSDNDRQFFAMEYLGRGFTNWKEQMLGGIFNEQTTGQAAALLSEIHRRSEGDEQLKKTFNATENFKSLRIKPYLVTTGKRHPELEKLFLKEAQRLERHREALVHGDFSPKNIMVKEERVVILDHEAAWFGDPAFDVAFLLNHLFLKMLFHYSRNYEIRDLALIVWKTYFAKRGSGRQQLEKRICRLLLMLMLARIDGKSPVEYLEEREKEFVRRFVYDQLTGQNFIYDSIHSDWKSKLKTGPF